MPLTTAISEHTAAGVNVRGRDLVQEIVGTCSYTDTLYLLVCGRLPSPAERSVLDACLVTLMEAGINASTVVARVTAGSQPGLPAVAVAAGLLTVGDRFAGSVHGCGEILAAAPTGRADRERHLRDVVRDHRERRAPVPGFGHGTHTGHDPRAERLLEVASAHGVSGAHVEALQCLSAALDDAVGRHMVLNATGAMAAVLLDAGLPPGSLAGMAVVARCGGLVAHVAEEGETPTGDRMWQGVRDTFRYEPPPVRAGATGA